MVPLSTETIESNYVLALVSLYEDQHAAGINNHPTLRGTLMKALSMRTRINKSARLRDQDVCKVIQGLMDGYTMDLYQ